MDGRGLRRRRLRDGGAQPGVRLASRFMTRAELARQIVYYRSLRFDRRRILYELRRKLGARWNRRVLEFVDAVLEHGGMHRHRAATRAARRCSRSCPSSSRRAGRGGAA